MKRYIQMLPLTVGAIFLTISLGGPSLAEVQPVPASREALLRMLSGYEYVPSAQDLARLGSGVPDLLMQIVKDPGAMKYHRLRALTLLRHYPDRPEVQSFLTNLLTEENLPGSFLRRAMVALGQTAKGKAIPTLTPFLSSKDVHSREAAAQALFATGEPSVADLLTQAAVGEPEAFLKKSMGKMSQELETGTLKKDEGASSKER